MVMAMHKLNVKAAEKAAGSQNKLLAAFAAEFIDALGKGGWKDGDEMLAAEVSKILRSARDVCASRDGNSLLHREEFTDLAIMVLGEAPAIAMFFNQRLRIEYRTMQALESISESLRTIGERLRR